MRKTIALENKITRLKIGEILEVRTPDQRAAAYRIALRLGLSISTRSKLVGKGYEIVKN